MGYLPGELGFVCRHVFIKILLLWKNTGIQYLTGCAIKCPFGEFGCPEIRTVDEIKEHIKDGKLVNITLL